MATSNTITFTGTSRYAQDFQNVINRAVAIAGLPITQLNRKVTQLNTQASALNDLDTKFSALSNAADAIATAMGSGSFNADVSDPSIAGVTVTDSAMEGAYSIEVTNLGAYTTVMSNDAGLLQVADPGRTSISTATNYSLTVGSSSYSITPSGNSLYSLAHAINASSAGVQATVVNLGSASAPDYRLSLQNTLLGATAIQLNAVTTDPDNQPVTTPLMTQQVEGSLATYKVDGSSQVASSDSRNVTIAPGLTVTMLAQSPAGQATSITLTRQSGPISNALQSFVTAYNAAVDDLNQQRGTTGGALSGQNVVYQLRDALNQMTSYYQGGSTIASLADLGVTFDKSANGHLDFDPTALLSASLSNMGAIASFLGDGATDGFLKSARAAMASVEDPTRGALKTAIAGNQAEAAHDNNEIATEQAKLDTYQTNLTNRMNAADALISAMEQQYTVISNLFAAMENASGRATTTNSLA